MVDNMSLLKGNFQLDQQSSFPLNVVKYTQLNDSAFPIIKFGMEERLMKKMFYADKVNLNEKLNDLINDEYNKNLMNSINNDNYKEFKGESQFITKDKKIFQQYEAEIAENDDKIRSNSFDPLQKNERTEEFGKRSNSETKIKGLFLETTKFIPLEKKMNQSILRGGPGEKEWGGSGGMRDIDQILRSIDEMQNKGFNYN